MVTLLAIAGGTILAWSVSRQQDADSDDMPRNVKHSRQDLRLIAYLLFGVVVMLGIIADRLP
jgi:hypothetical protein